MQTVAETQGFLASAKAEGMTAEEITLTINEIAQNPEAGDLIVGSGGCRKVRIAGKGKGKSGGYRVVTLFGGGHMPVYLLAMLAKGSKANFSKAQVAAMATVAKKIKDAHRTRAAS